MNTKLDETTLARWLDDELQGAELAAAEDAVRGDGDLIARREAVRAWRREIGAALPAVVEPPYPDFFNSRIEQALRQSARRPWAAAGAGSWWGWWLPAASVAGMALTFWLGTKTAGRQAAEVALVPSPVPVLKVEEAPAVYTPEGGVAAEWFSSTEAAATVIVLEGLEAIPDTLDFSETVGVEGDDDAMVGLAGDAGEGGIVQ
jgi:hypothetical protein